MLRIFPGSLTGITDLLGGVVRSGELYSVSGLEGGAGGGAAEARLQAENRLRVELRDPGLGDAQHLADLAEGQLFVVVERDHELLALGQARDRVGDRLLHLDLGERALR